MKAGDKDERMIMIMAEPENGDGYVYGTSDAQRAIKQYKDWCVQFGVERVRANEGFDRHARPLMELRAAGPSGAN